MARLRPSKWCYDELALLRQILAARSIIGAAMRTLKRLTEQAQFDAGSQQGDRLAAVFTSRAFAAASPRPYVAASVEPADRDLAWRRIDRVLVGGCLPARLRSLLAGVGFG